jgi:hypothetical protein
MLTVNDVNTVTTRNIGGVVIHPGTGREDQEGE